MGGVGEKLLLLAMDAREAVEEGVDSVDERAEFGRSLRDEEALGCEGRGSQLLGGFGQHIQGPDPEGQHPGGEAEDK